MKTRFLKTTMMIGCAALMMGCGSGKEIAQTSNKESTISSKTQKQIQDLQNEAALIEAQSRLAEVKRKAAAEAASAVMDFPCFTPDSEEWYTGNVARRRSANAINTLATACLRAARQNLQQKIKGTLKQVTRDYFDQMDIDEKSAEASHIESASDYVVNQFMNDMQEICRKVTQPDDQGMITMYMSVKISKKALVDKLATKLSQDEKTRVRFDEQKFREDAFKVFSEDRQQSLDNYMNEQ